jgi:hypothetical protein
MTLMAKNDRIFELEIIDNTQPKSSTGMTDTRLFKGGNKLHIKKDSETNFWSFFYDEGVTPQPLQCNFTNFTTALRHAEVYYKTRNLKIKEIDA